ncbi:MAG: mandelate racemase/muconate lactonizing enzyme family protein [Gemmatimonadetes bacterium]|jgi:L-alanine-DL-glutamate epimerase-like enolase superfamily enzyme|nr:mandelate racemase/muconate lactonizing enzyme family protein [Gemmatimonadota bacterium]MBT6144488.1 mandelate racemase/muconate lactonizing enzyme family protein [Gemmatimonadota bacterium]MBT7864304.1 mandelate racemase/muconate lactonizing enzyme family protein [Gemmatimonadota bacterium]
MTSTSDFTITNIERWRLNVPFHERCAHTVDIRVPGWSVVDLYRVTLASGAIGVGETLDNYTWGRIEDDGATSHVGDNAMELMWQDSLGAGLQMAIFDAVGQTAQVPIHRLLGVQHREAVPVSWWAQDMAPRLWAAEATAAEANGFTTMKVKARPWFDIEDQLEAVSEATSNHFQLDADFNGLLLGVDQAAPLLRRLEETFPVLAILESPIPQDDVAGNAALRRKIVSPIAMHFGSPPVMTAISEGVCDGFVIGGGATTVMSQGTIAGQAKMPFWLQMVGTGLTTTFAAHLGAVLTQARWPAIPCINIYSHTLLKEFEVTGGHLQVPDAPGLGVDLDWDAIEGFRVADDFKRPAPREIHTIHWPDGRQSHYPNGSYREEFLAGKLPGFLPGVRLERGLDDESEEFDRRYQELFG